MSAPMCPDCGRPITLNASGWWSHDGMPDGCWRVSMDGPNTEDEESAMIDLDTEFRQYVETALWSSTDDEGSPLDSDYDLDDIAPESLASMREELEAFIAGTDADAIDYWQTELGAGQIGHDFWLTRNGHGAGFWDRFARGIGADYGRRLTDDAKPYGSSDLYVGDDGRLYIA